MRRLLLLFAVCASSLSGCAKLMHELQPHRMWRWNYQEPEGRTDEALFSISDDLSKPVVGKPPAIDRQQTSDRHD